MPRHAPAPYTHAPEARAANSRGAELGEDGENYARGQVGHGEHPDALGEEERTADERNEPDPLGDKSHFRELGVRQAADHEISQRYGEREAYPGVDAGRANADDGQYAGSGSGGHALEEAGRAHRVSIGVVASQADAAQAHVQGAGQAENPLILGNAAAQPVEGQSAAREAEAGEIGQRVKLGSKFGGHAPLARQEAVGGIEHHREQQGASSPEILAQHREIHRQHACEHIDAGAQIDEKKFDFLHGLTWSAALRQRGAARPEWSLISPAPAEYTSQPDES